MTNYIATEAVIPLRSSPSESAEMVSQILFGEILTGSRIEGNWCFVKNESDGYEGWLTKYMMTEIPAPQSQMNSKQFVCQQGVSLQERDGTALYLPMGARIPIGGNWEQNGQLVIGSRHWQKPAEGLLEAHLENDVLSIIQSFLNVPYLWGGRSSFGIDCSGLTQVAFSICGKSLPRDSGQQWKQGEMIPWESREAGDLAFFTQKDETKISHVGMFLSKNLIIHASGRVRIDEINQEGIVRKEDQKLSHYLVGLKRIL